MKPTVSLDDVAAPAPLFSWALVGLSLSTLLSSLGTSIANVALPTLEVVFHASFQQVQWVVLAYLLVITCLSVSAGRLGDLVGQKRLLLMGLGVFTVASLWCGLSGNLGILIAARGLQGLGAAIMMALTLALVGTTFSKTKMGGAVGLLGTMSAVGTALGPSLGGVLLQASDWPALFFMQVPLGISALWLLHRFLPADQVKSDLSSARLDPLGTGFLAVALACYALSMTLEQGHSGQANGVLLFVALAGLFAFIWHENRAPSPLVDLRTFKQPLLGAGFVLNLLVTTVVMATLVVGPFYLSGGLNLNSAQVGLVMTCGPLVSALTGVPAGRLVDRSGALKMTTVGLVAMLTGSIVLALLSSRLGVVGYIVPLVLLTSGYALFQAANNTAVLKGVFPERRGVMSGLLSLSRNLGLITGASMMGKVFILGSGPARDVVSGMEVAFGVSTGLVGMALLVLWASSRASQPNAERD